MSFLARGLCVAIAIAFVQSSGAQVVPEHAQLADPQGEPVVVGSIHRIQSSVRRRAGADGAAAARLCRKSRQALGNPSDSPMTLLCGGFEKRGYTPEARTNLDAGKCTRAIAKPVTFEEKNRRERELYGMCLLMKPGSKPTAGNMGPSDFGGPVR